MYSCDNNKILVSVCVVTYNSAQYIMETLESIKAQNYSYIELIISDDCSTDETLSICRSWVCQNNDRFVRCVITGTIENSGVAANLNNAISHCNGTWIKSLAGDDLLYSDCISKNMQYINTNQSIGALFSIAHSFIMKGSQMNLLSMSVNDNIKSFFVLDAYAQYKILLRSNFLPAATYFCKAEIAKNNLYNEKYKYLEDYPMWLKLTKQGIKLHYMDYPTVLYRRGESLCSSKEHFYSPRHFSSLSQFFWSELIYYIREEGDNEAYNAHMQYMYGIQFCDAFLGNQKTFVNRLIYKIVRTLLHHFAYFKLC